MRYLQHSLRGQCPNRGSGPFERLTSSTGSQSRGPVDDAVVVGGEFSHNELFKLAPPLEIVRLKSQSPSETLIFCGLLSRLVSHHAE